MKVSDLEYFFQPQLDDETKFLNDPAINNQTIIVNDFIVGSIAKYFLRKAVSPSRMINLAK
ncbi:MAG: hypothetical protein JST21_03925 [Bacteroidetes bacterium]|nr:hypothetical protein [Bacteroidota bacterium]